MQREDLVRRIERVIAIERQRMLQSGLLRLICAACLLTLLYFSIDWLFDAPNYGRWIMLTAGLFYLGYVAIKHFYYELLCLPDARAVLNRAEKNFPQLAGKLYSTYELTRQGITDFSDELLDALTRETLEKLSGISFERLIQTPRPTRAFCHALGAILLLGLCVQRYPQHFVIMLARMMEPDLAYPTKTRIASYELPERVARGEPIMVRILLDKNGRIPQEPGKLIFGAGGSQQTHPLLPQHDGTYSGQLPSALEDTQVQVVIGDLHRRLDRQIRVFALPELAQAEIEVRLPPYTGDTRIVRQHLSAATLLKGSSINVVLKSITPLRNASVKWSDGRIEELKAQDQEGLFWRSTQWQVVDAEIKGTIHLLDRNGFGNRMPSIEYTIAITPDLPAIVRLREPGRDQTVLPAATIPVTLDAQDDYGLRQVVLACITQRADGRFDKERIQIFSASVHGNARTLNDLQYNLDLKPLRLIPGERLRLWAEAYDFCDSNSPAQTSQQAVKHAAQSSDGRSDEVLLFVVDPAEKQREFYEQAVNVYEQLRQLRDRQELLKRRHDTLAE